MSPNQNRGDGIGTLSAEQKLSHARQFLSTGGGDPIDYANRAKILPSEFMSGLYNKKIQAQLTPAEQKLANETQRASMIPDPKVTSRHTAVGGRTNAGSQLPRNPVGGTQGSYTAADFETAHTMLELRNSSGTSSSTKERSGAWKSPPKSGGGRHH